MLQVELIGRVQRQRADNRFYTCICYLRVVGTPVYGFLPSTTVSSISIGHQSSSRESHSSCQKPSLHSQEHKHAEVQQPPVAPCCEPQAAAPEGQVQECESAGTENVSEGVSCNMQCSQTMPWPGMGATSAYSCMLAACCRSLVSAG